MKNLLLIAAACGAAFAQTKSAPPAWAYGIQEPAVQAPKAPPPNSDKQHLPGTELTFTRAQIGDRFGPADWFPGDHPAMPDIISRGRKPEVWACGLCHYPNGKGRPENASVSGFTAEYFIGQMHAFRDGNRKSADDRKKNTNIMIAIAKAMTDEEIKVSAEYFAAMKWTPWIKVVETKTVPKMYTSVGMFLPFEGSEREALGRRIIETPVNAEETEALRNPRSGFIAYAPIGSVAKGRKLVRSAQCAICHGEDLRGLGIVPGIAGRSPSYLMRQLYDMQQGTRKGLWTDMMRPVVAKLTNDDMLNIAAYTSSQTP